MARGLAVGDVVNVTVDLSPKATIYRNFGAHLIIGSTPGVIDVAERIRAYSGSDGVAQDFGTAAPEYLAAQLYFSQAPKPALCYIGRWAQAATAGLLHGGPLAPADQVMSVFTGITTGSMAITIDGAVKTLTGLNFSGALNLNGVAAVVTAALAGAATVTWDSVRSRFDVRSSTTGAASAVSYASPTGSGVDVSSKLFLTQAKGASAPIVGIVAETLLSCLATMADVSGDWYGAQVATATPPTLAEHLAAAQFIEATTKSRVYGATVQAAAVLDAADATDLCSQLKALGLKRTFTQYSSVSPYAVASAFGRAFTVNFEGSNTTLTLKFKQEPGVVAETLTETQARTLAAKNCNVLVNYDNASAILQEGEMANGYFFDEVHGTDWLQNAIQTDVYNLLYQSKTKVPQTDEGIHLIVTTIEKTLTRAVRNGLVAPGVWNADGFGSLAQGDTLTKGYYIYAPLVATQAPADREARKSPPIQVAVKLAGAVHSVDVLISVNR